MRIDSYYQRERMVLSNQAQCNDNLKILKKERNLVSLSFLTDKNTMGNGQSDIKSRLSYNTLPKHLRPLPPKKLDKLKKLNKQYSQKTQVPSEIPDFYEHLEKQSQNDSGPRGAFRWLKGRRFFNHTSSCLLPNDQLELDRSRVQAFILRWVFGG